MFFYFTLKAFFVLKIFEYLSWCFTMYKSNLIKKIRLILKFMMSQIREQTTEIQILPNISKSKGNQKMKFWSVNSTKLEKHFS